MGRRNRRKLGSRCYKNYTKEMLDIAVDLVKQKKLSSLEAEKRFYIPRRTIENKVKGLHLNAPGSQLRLNNSEEKEIVEVLIAAGEFGAPLSRLDLRILIFEYLTKNRRTYIFDNKPPGKWWVKHFLDRHKDALTERSVQNIKKVRAEKSVQELENYFINLEQTLKDVPAPNILNYDETNFSDNPGTTKCIFKRTVKYPERILNHSKGNISVMFAASAEGSLLPVYTVYKSEHLWTTWCANGPPDARYNRTKSGWFERRVFEDWFESTVIPWATKLQGPKVVIGDNLSSHLNVNIVRLCEQNEIRFAFLPPNSTHITQPLDVAYFGPLKRFWRQILTQYKIQNPSHTQINKAHFPKLLKELLDKTNLSNKHNIVAGFKTTGLFPFNMNKVLNKLPDYEDKRYKIDEVLLDFLKKSRAPYPIIKNISPNKKVKVEPGRSVSSQDLESLLRGVKKITQIISSSKNSRQSNTHIKSTEEKKITILSDIRLSPENKRYFDLRQCNSLNLKRVDIITAKKDENTNPYENPQPSTSGMCKETNSKMNNIRKRTKSLKPRKGSKKVKFEYDSDKESDGDYSLRDTSEEENYMSEYEDMALKMILEDSCNEGKKITLNKNENRETKLQIRENLPVIESIGDYFNNGKRNEEENKVLDVEEIKIKQNENIKEQNLEIVRTKYPKTNQCEENEHNSENKSVLVRYYIRKKWKFYVGFVKHVDVQELDTYYTITFLKIIKKPNLRFVIPKREDYDVVPSSSIVKCIRLYSGKESINEYFIDDCDKHYF